MKRPARFLMLMVVPALFCAGIQTAAADGPARLLKDINQTLALDEMSSWPEAYHRFGGLTLFRARTRDTGFELWRTDGTAPGTWMLKDFRPGWQSGVLLHSFEYGALPFDPAHLGSEALFPATDGVHGWELWKTDGTEAGTRLVKEIRPGSGGPFDGRDRESSFVVSWAHAETRGLVYFIADDGEHGFELWRTDGTDAGTFMLRDIRPGSESPFGSPYRFTFPAFQHAVIDGRLYFTADDGAHGMELWTTDGTKEGTVLLKDVAAGFASSNPRQMVTLGGWLIFWADPKTETAKLWRSNGTTAGTVQIRNLGSFAQNAAKLNDAVIYASGSTLYRTDATFEGTRPVAQFAAAPTLFQVLDGRLVLAVNDGVHGVELWTSDGTAPGTGLVKDIRSGPDGSGPSHVVAAGGRLFFNADDGQHGRELWTSDGNGDGTHLVADLTPGLGSSSLGLHGLADICWFTMYGTAQTGIWVTDGTEAGTQFLIDQAQVQRVGDAPDGALLFSYNDGTHGAELWRSDGSESGTALLKDLNTLVRTRPSFTRVIGSLDVPGAGPRILLTADDDVHGTELWVTDGTAQGTRMLKDINPGPADSYPGVVRRGDGFFLLIANDGVHGPDLWRTDGTEAGTVFVEELWPGPDSWIFSPLIDIHGVKYFIAADDAHGWELWRTDLTAAGTYLAAETIPGPDSSINDWPFAVGETIYFQTYDYALNEYELWKSDGTQEGTLRVRRQTDDFLFPNDFAPFGDRLFMTAFDFDHGWEPYISDGTEAGTHRLLDINPGPRHGVTFPSNATPMNGFIYFAASERDHLQDLWRSDGTEAGTTRVKELRPGSANSGLNNLVAHDGTLYFTAGSSSSHTWELWKSDGTEPGTVRIGDDLGAFLNGLSPVPGGLLFTAWDEDHGFELWRSDGTREGTGFAQEIAAGPFLDSRPQGFTVVGSRVFFRADDGFANTELWVARTAILMNQPSRAIQDLRGEVAASGLERNMAKSLMTRLDAAALALTEGRTKDAIAALNVFGRLIEALAPRWITQAVATDLRGFAGEIAGFLEGTGPRID